MGAGFAGEVVFHAAYRFLLLGFTCAVLTGTLEGALDILLLNFALSRFLLWLAFPFGGCV